MSLPRFVYLDACAFPDPRWKPEQGRKGASRSAHPCILVLALLDEHGRPWVYDEVLGIRRIEEKPDSAP